MVSVLFLTQKKIPKNISQHRDSTVLLTLNWQTHENSDVPSEGDEEVQTDVPSDGDKEVLPNVPGEGD